MLRSVCTPVCMTVEYLSLYAAARLHYYYDFMAQSQIQSILTVAFYKQAVCLSNISQAGWTIIHHIVIEYNAIVNPNYMCLVVSVCGSVGEGMNYDGS